MKHGALTLIAGLFLYVPSKGQSYFFNERYLEPAWLWEGGIRFGVMNCKTDLGKKAARWWPVSDIALSETRPAGSIYIQALHNHRIGFRIQFTSGTISGADSLVAKDTGPGRARYERNLHFRSRIMETLLLIEFYPFSFREREDLKQIQCYLLGGSGWFHFNPEAKWNHHWIELHPLHTEGQGFGKEFKRTGRTYSLNQWNIPLGAGIRLDAGPHFHCRLEILYRFLRTDYLDDVSTTYVDPKAFERNLPPYLAVIAIQLADRSKQTATQNVGTIRGNPLKKDAYLDCQLSIGYLFNRKKR